MNRRKALMFVVVVAVASMVQAQSTTAKTDAPPMVPGASVTLRTEAAPPAALREPFGAFSADSLRAHIRFLSSDLLEGRGPGTRGDALATSYIAAQFEALGLEPAGDDGTFFQNIPLIGISTKEESTKVSITKDGSPVIGPLQYRVEFVGGNQSQEESVKLDSELVFVGHGVRAPEYRWDDYRNFDARGKTLVMLVDDPPANEKEPDLFKGNARTYYGRWTYKYEIGTELGADGVILIHTDAAAGYGWPVVRNSWTGEQAYVKGRDGAHALKFAGWISEATAQRLMKAAGFDLATLTKSAASRNFKPVSLGHRLTADVASSVRPFTTRNVIARLPGADPQLSSEAVLYTAHHDHLGIGMPDDDDPTDTIYNGAVDNASGTAALIELARVWKLVPRARRSIYFAAVAAEEQGLLGSEYLAQHPPVPAGRIVLGLNYDAMGLLGEAGSVTLNGVDRTTFHPTALSITGAMNLKIVGDRAPEQGSYYRSDHFSLAKVGVPAFSVSMGSDIIGKPEEWVRERRREYGQKHYHQASDEFDPSWDYSGVIQGSRLGLWLGYEAANATAVPNWLPGEEFRAVRDKSLESLR